MKFLFALLLFPIAVMAAGPANQAGAPQGMPNFDQFKSKMQPVIDQTLPLMQEAKDCVTKAGSTEDVEVCMQKMLDARIAVQQQLGMPAPPDTGMDMTKAPEGFEWNEDSKNKMIQRFDMAIQQTSAMSECLSSSSSGQEMGDCIKQKTPAPGQP